MVDQVTAAARERVYREMINEIDARVAPLQLERLQLLNAATRLKTIEIQLQVLADEREEYAALLAPTTVAVVTEVGQ